MSNDWKLFLPMCSISIYQKPKQKKKEKLYKQCKSDK